MLKSRGFTLIELVVTITLLGLLVALSLPSFVGWIKNTQVRTVAEALQTGLRVAQTEALRRNTEVIFYRTNAAVTAAAASSAGTVAYASGGVNWVVVTVPQFGSTTVDFVQGGALGGAASSSTITDPGPMCFDANGRVVVNTPATLPTGATCSGPNLNNTYAFNVSQPAPADRALNVIVTPGGKVRMCDPTRTFSATAPDGC